MPETQSPSVLDLEEARRVREAATQGEWRLDRLESIVTSDGRGYVAEAYDGLRGQETDLDLARGNAAFIAYAANNWTALLSRLSRAEEENARLREALENIAAKKMSREEFMLQGPAFACRRAEEFDAIARAALGATP